MTRVSLRMHGAAVVRVHWHERHELRAGPRQVGVGGQREHLARAFDTNISSVTMFQSQWPASDPSMARA